MNQSKKQYLKLSNKESLNPTPTPCLNSLGKIVKGIGKNFHTQKTLNTEKHLNIEKILHIEKTKENESSNWAKSQSVLWELYQGVGSKADFEEIIQKQREINQGILMDIERERLEHRDRMSPMEKELDWLLEEYQGYEEQIRELKEFMDCLGI